MYILALYNTGMCIHLFFRISSGDIVISIDVSGGGGGVFVVDLVFIHAWRMWPFAVASDLRRCFLTRAAVSPGQVEK